MPLVVFEKVGKPRVGEFWTPSEVKKNLKFIRTVWLRYSEHLGQIILCIFRSAVFRVRLKALHKLV